MIEKSNIVIDQNTDIDSILYKITRDKIAPEFIILDLFCGAGGTTTGFEMAGGIAKVIACVNHDKFAIQSHWANHPNVLHFEEDIRTLNLDNLIRIVNHYRKLYPDAKLAIWASLECTNHSKAKGGQSRDADSRTLPDHLPKYIIALNPDYVMIENVVEFMAWGPLRIACKKQLKRAWPKKGIYPQSRLKIIFNKKTQKKEYAWTPEKSRNGEDWIRWSNHINSFGYRNEWNEMNSANFGAYTSRNRFFQCFAKKGLPICWPEVTHSKNALKKEEPTLFNIGLEPWKPVKDVLDFDDEGESIFTRKKPLVENTLKVIAKGIEKAMKEGNNSILYKYYGNGDNLNSINTVAGTLTTKDRFGVLKIVLNQYRTGYCSSVNAPIGTMPTVPKQNILSFILNPSHGGHTTSTNKSCPVLIARQDKAPLYLVQLMEKYGIIDIKMRMLKIDEMLVIQGFPKSYILKGTLTDQKKFIGNSVVPEIAKVWILAFSNKFTQLKKAA